MTGLGAGRRGADVHLLQQVQWKEPPFASQICKQMVNNRDPFHTVSLDTC